jgi:hypothetical protein
MKKEDIIKYFQGLTYSGFKNFFENYKKVLIEDGYPERIDTTVIFPEAKKAIACFIIDCTDDDFNKGAYGSLEFIMEITENNEQEIDIMCHQFRVTVDPARNKQGIAHVARQIYRGNRGYHHGDSRRICIRSDYAGTWFRRSNTSGEFIKLPNGHIVAKDKIGINNHDQGEYYDSSAGCVILWGGGWMVKDSPYTSDFKPMLEDCTNPGNIPMCVLIDDDIEDVIIGSRANAINGSNPSPGEKEAGRAGEI